MSCARNDYTDGISKGLWGTREDGYDWGMPVKGVQCFPGRDVCQEQMNMGNTLPDFNVSASSLFRWKGLQLYVLVDWEQGADIYNQTRQRAVWNGNGGEMDQADKPDGLKKPMGYYTTLVDAVNPNSHFVEDGSFVKVRELSLGYALDGDQLSRWLGEWLPLSRLSANLIGRNLLTFTDYTGHDPEVGYSGITSGALDRWDVFIYPNYRTLTLSLEAVF